jgi:hypothetical protein
MNGFTGNLDLSELGTGIQRLKDDTTYSSPIARRFAMEQDFDIEITLAEGAKPWLDYPGNMRQQAEGGGWDEFDLDIKYDQWMSVPASPAWGAGPFLSARACSQTCGSCGQTCVTCGQQTCAQTCATCGQNTCANTCPTCGQNTCNTCGGTCNTCNNTCWNTCANNTCAQTCKGCFTQDFPCTLTCGDSCGCTFTCGDTQCGSTCGC